MSITGTARKSHEGIHEDQNALPPFRRFTLVYEDVRLESGAGAGRVSGGEQSIRFGFNVAFAMGYAVNGRGRLSSPVCRTPHDDGRSQQRLMCREIAAKLDT